MKIYFYAVQTFPCWLLTLYIKIKLFLPLVDLDIKYFLFNQEAFFLTGNQKLSQF